MKTWTIPTILRELRRAVKESTGIDIMETTTYKVEDMVGDLTQHHMNKEMEIPGQTAIVVGDEDEGM